MSIKEKTDAELVADARQVTGELNGLHREIARRGIHVDWFYGDGAQQIRFEYSRIEKEAL